MRRPAPGPYARASGKGSVARRGPAAAEEKRHDQRVREADLGAIHEAVARALDDREHVMVLRIEHEAREGLHGVQRRARRSVQRAD